MTVETATTAIQVTVRGNVRDVDRDYALRKLEYLLPLVHSPVLSGHIVLSWEAEHAPERRALIEIGLDVNGVPVRAHVTSSSMHEAADLVQERLRRRLTQLQDRARTRHRWPSVVTEQGRVRAGTPGPRPAMRPVESREVLRRKTFALRPLSREEAAYEMDLLDHDFYLFTDLETGADSVICHQPGTRPKISDEKGTDLDEYVVLASPPSLTEAQAIERLDVGGENLVFYRDVEDGRGRVLYQRFDGHYGLITSA